jgi:isopentenyldiphosphate isomerase
MELWDVLDEHGNKTGKIIERGTELGQGEYRLVIDVWIINKNKEFLISKRIPTKQPEPGKWNPVCGSAIAGEDSVSAALIETKEELGITLNAQNGRLIKRFTAWQTAIIDVWLFDQEVDINNVVLQEEETDEVMWATGSMIKQIVEKDDFICYERIPYIDELFEICGV